MKKTVEIREKIELARQELDQAVLVDDGFELFYEKSVMLDKLIEEYLDEEEKKNCKKRKGAS